MTRIILPDRGRFSRDARKATSRAPSTIGAGSRRPLTVSPGVIYHLPNQMEYEHSATIVRGDSPEGAQLLGRFAEQGMPPALFEAGFTEVSDLWQPWCIAIKDGDIAATAFAARLGDIGAEIGVYTFPQFRSRGFGTAVTAACLSSPSLDGRALFSSTSRSNRSSQRVAARLRLRMIGASVVID